METRLIFSKSQYSVAASEFRNVIDIFQSPFHLRNETRRKRRPMGCDCAQYLEISFWESIDK